MTPRDLADATEHWDLDVLNVSKSFVVCRAEAAVHELAHAAVFHWRAIDHTLPTRLARRYRAWDDAIAADESEVETLAVERVALRILGWHRRVKSPVGQTAFRNDPGSAYWSLRVEDVAKTPKTRRRAERVVEWVRELVAA